MLVVCSNIIVVSSTYSPDFEGLRRLMLKDVCGFLECENLIRRMLVVDPKKRLTIGQVCHHQWMTTASEDVRCDPDSSAHGVSTPEEGLTADKSQFNENVLRVMQNLNIDEQKTLQVYNGDYC
jgi:serine/threonine protein kinase